MNLTLDPGAAAYRIGRYQNNCIQINGVDHSETLVILPEMLIAPWRVQRYHDLSLSDVETLIPLNPEVILFGTDSPDKFKKSDVMTPLVKKQMGFEIMGLGAACRTYTVLMTEKRRVCAVLFLE